ncbi:DUF1648 domain-containing protein [Meiothermus sp. CFH 77666]|uniref:DUF1648 domain-containing protein n=1 Tax=Meiothermus sp. CFH 77666 TaxID=2817942 RepID=UPI001AA052ED|nr:DUF1648 domain-containing protein [Meiothermus sp. CFH 77666]
MKASPPWWLVFIGLIGLWGLSALLYPLLPDRIPGHFGLSGGVTQWVPKKSFWILPIVATLGIPTTFTLIRMAMTDYTFLNLPNKNAFLSLETEQQQRILRYLDDGLAGVHVLMLLMFGYVQYETYRVALNTVQSLGSFIWGILAILLVYVVWLNWKIWRMVGLEAQRTR